MSHSPSRQSRRHFLVDTAAKGLSLGAGLTILADARSVSGSPANDKLSIAMIGVKGRGNKLAKGFLAREDCEISYVCDVNTAVGERRVGQYATQQNRKPRFVQDFRKMLDDQSVDAVVIATPNHWHAPATVWSCQAGKDVYIEKPVSHNIWEGRKMVESARKYKRVVQAGTQSRSAPYCKEAKRYIEEGKLGRIHLCKVFDMKQQGNFTLPPNSDPPAGLDWDMWNGPAPERPYNSKILLGGWQHLWNYSGGDAANDSSHQLDLARWLVGVELPKAVYCTGGRFDSEGDAQTPDTQIASYEYDDMIMTFEMTLYTPYMLKSDRVLRDSDIFPHWPQNASRIEIYGSKGVMCLGRHGGGWQVFARPKSRKPVVAAQRYGRYPDPEHKQDFFNCIRNRGVPNADIRESHLSVLLTHYANISYRLGGEKLLIDRKTEGFVNNDRAMQFYKRDYRRPWVVEEKV